MGNPATTWSINWGSVAQWIGGLATLLAVLVALFKDSLLRKLRRPKLFVRIMPAPPDSIKELWRYHDSLQSRSYKETNRYMFRLWVSNEGNHDRAEKVQVFARKLEKLAADRKTYVSVEEFLPMNLVWSNTRESFLEGISAHGMGKHCDLCHITNPVALVDLQEDRSDTPSGKAVLALDLEFLPLTKIHLLPQGTYRLELMIAGVNTVPVLKALEISFTGDWYEDPQRMFRDGARIRILD